VRRQLLSLIANSMEFLFDLSKLINSKLEELVDEILNFPLKVTMIESIHIYQNKNHSRELNRCLLDKLLRKELRMDEEENCRPHVNNFICEELNLRSCNANKVLLVCFWLSPCSFTINEFNKLEFSQFILPTIYVGTAPCIDHM
jgi:hypothetical protein